MRFWPKAKAKLYFGCNQCGDCCREMRIPPSHRDILRIQALHPHRPLAEWLQVYPVETNHPDAVWLNQKPGMLLLRQQQGACTFLVDGARCGIYDVRPRVCRIWPFEHIPGERALRIAPQHEMLVKLACDATPVSSAEILEMQAEMDAIAREYRAYDLLIQRWNQQTREASSEVSASSKYGLEEFIGFLSAKA